MVFTIALVFVSAERPRKTRPRSKTRQKDAEDESLIGIVQTFLTQLLMLCQSLQCQLSFFPYSAELGMIWRCHTSRTRDDQDTGRQNQGYMCILLSDGRQKRPERFDLLLQEAVAETNQ